MVADAANLALTAGPTDPLLGHTGEGRGKQVEEPKSPLSQLIEALNERFGMNLDDADRIWFEQQEEHLHADEEVRVVAINNDFEQFKVFLTPVIEGKIVDRHQANGELFDTFFANVDFRDQMQAWLAEQLWKRIREEQAEAG
jgi:type I restriction enzyme R subunit